MRDVYLIGAGQSRFGSFPDETYRTLFEIAVDEALTSIDSLERTDIDESFVGTLGVGGRQIGLSGPAVTEFAGIQGIPTTRVENACAASGYAIRSAVQAVKSGMADIVLAGGYEVMTDTSGDVTRYWLGVSGETEWERLAGTTFSGVYAQMASAHMERYGTTADQLGAVAVKNHDHGSRNPKAHLGFTCTMDDVRSAPTVADPLNLFHCCPTTDGAAAVIIAAPSVARELADTPIKITGVGAASDGVGLFQRDTYTSLPASRRAAEQAYEMADIGPEDLDLAEVHDCFAIAELLAYEDLGICEPGGAGELVESGATALGGDLPVNTSGGLKSKGHPIGATGAGQAVEIFEQLTNNAGDRQVDGARIGLTHNVGGSGGAAVVHLFERLEEVPA